MLIKNILMLPLLFFCGTCFSEKTFISPEGSTGVTHQPLVYGQHDMVVTNNPWASKAASEILKRGGNAVDAAVAAAFVLGLTEPASSGLGGGGFALTYNQSKKNVLAYDGREIAPRSATAGLFLDEKGKPMLFDEASLSFKSVGVPSEVALLYQMHHQQGLLKWQEVVQPAIHLARKGFPMSPRLHRLLAMDRDILIKNARVKSIYFTPKGEVKSVHSIIKNTDYAHSLMLVADNPRHFYIGKIAKDIVNTINQAAGYPIYSMQDLRNYSVSEDKALCSNYRADKICSVPFASGGVTLLELMNIYANNFSGKSHTDVNWMYHFLEASKLAYADRNQYIADPAFVQQPLDGLLANKYVLQRSQKVTSKALLTPVPAGIPSGIDPKYAPDTSSEEHGTTSLAVVDSSGNAVSMSMSIEHQFGSHLFVDGFFLNNELTDFSFLATNEFGKPIANRVEPLKRPRSAMASAMVFNKEGQLIAISGSPGGSPIICYVAKSLIQMLDFNKNPAQASAIGNLCALNSTPVIETNSDGVDYLKALNQKGELATTSELVSGIVNIKRAQQGGWYGAADPRREGEAIGG